MGKPKTARQTFIEQVTSLFDDQNQKKEIQEAIDSAFDEIREELSKDINEDHEQTKKLIDDLTESRDEALRRAQEAETELEQVKTEAAEAFTSIKEVKEEEAREALAEAEKKIEELETKLDEVEMRVSESYEEARENDFARIVDKVGSFLESKTETMVERVVAELNADPANINAEAVIQQIASVIAGHKNETVDIEVKEQNESLQNQVDMLNAQIIRLESRNTRLVRENEILEEQVKSGGSMLNEVADDEEEVSDSSEGEDTTSESRGTSRVAQLLSEAIKPKESNEETADSEGDWLDEGNDPDRNERASAVDGEGDSRMFEDIYEETISENETHDTNDKRIVEGTDSSIGDLKRLAGISKQY